MKSSIIRHSSKIAIVAILLLFCAPSRAQRDHFTDAETDLIRFYQELDKRIEVMIKAADRRFAIINGAPQPSTKRLVKDEPDWGEVPKGTRAQLLDDIAGILEIGRASCRERV